MKGHTTNYIIVKVKTDEKLENTLKCVKIVDNDDVELIGEII